MKTGLMFASTSFTTAEECAVAVEAAENVGIESIWSVDHVFTPLQLESPYPYSEDGRVAGLNETVFCDPVVWLAFVAGISSKLRLGTGVMILPQRHPALVAKEWATLDRLSGGRAMMGVGIGWLREEMEGLGIPFGERGARMDESLAAIRSLWSEGNSTVKGKFYNWKEMISNPKPMQKPGVPIIIGGHSAAAARRVARFGDGFFSVGSLSQVSQGGKHALQDMLHTIHSECRAIGRDPATVEITVGAHGASREQLLGLRDLGVSRVMIGVGKRDMRRRLEDFHKLVQSVG